MPKKATSPRKAAASRANGAKSQGPKTPDGKARSSMNAFKHGVYAESLILPTEDPADFEQLRTYYLHRFQPTDQVEADLVNVMILSMWRLRRTAAIDTGILVREFQSAERTVSGFRNLDPATRFSLAALRHLNLNGSAVTALDRQEAKLYRHFSRAMNDLLKLRKNFPNPEDPPPVENRANEPTPVAPTSDGLTSPPSESYPESLLVEARQPSVTAKVVPICLGKAVKGAEFFGTFRRNRSVGQAA